jgi:uncharacterized protein YceK
MAGLVRQMKFRQFSKALQMLGAACVVLTSGCATAFVRSKNTVAPQHVFPATAFDGQLFWNSGIKGEPLFATVDPNAKNGPVMRVAYGVGAIIDLPFSIVFDTILLPMDLTQSGTSAEDGPKGEPSTPQELSARAAQFIGRGIRVVEKPGQMHAEAGPFGPTDMVTYEGELRVYTGVLQAVLNNQIILAPPEAAPKTFRVRGLFRANDGQFVDAELNYATSVQISVDRVQRVEFVDRFAERDLSKFRMQTVEIPMSAEIKELYRFMHEFHLFQNVLRFQWAESDIDIARSASMRPLVDMGLEQAGFDPESLRIQWLDPGRLFWMKWETFPQGQGRYSKQGHLVLQIDGGSLKELFRDSIYAYGSGGMLDSSKVDLDIRYDPSIRELSLVRTTVLRGSSDEKRLFMEDQLTTDQGDTIYFGENSTQTVWRYRIENGRLRFVSGDYSAQLPKERSVLDVAEAFQTSAAKLRRLNPKLNDTDRVSGTLVLEDRIGPYAHQNDDGICRDQPCSKQ